MWFPAQIYRDEGGLRSKGHKGSPKVIRMPVNIAFKSYVVFALALLLTLVALTCISAYITQVVLTHLHDGESLALREKSVAIGP